MSTHLSKFSDIIALIPEGKFTVDDLGDRNRAKFALNGLNAKGYIKKAGTTRKPRFWAGPRGRPIQVWETTPKFWTHRRFWVQEGA